MNTIAVLNTGLQVIIARLQKEKEDLYNSYNSAIRNGEKYERIKALYLTLKDAELKLRDLLRSNHPSATMA